MGCSPCINVNLIPLKVLIFSFYGGLGCVLPFLTIHMKSLGFNVQETAFINFVLPFLCLLGPPIAGVIADKICRYKPVMVCCLIMTALAYAGLLFVPETQRLSPRPPELSFTCSRDAGALVAERCSDTEACIHKDDNRVIEVAVRDCVVKCPNATLRRSVGTKDSYALMLSDAGPRSLESKADISPNLCSVDASGKISSCRVMSSKGEDYPFIFTTNLPRYVMKPRHCLYPMTHFIHEGSEYFSLRCKNVPSNCIAWCTAYERRTLFLSRGMPLGKAFTSPLAAAAAQRGSDGPRRETTSISNKTAVASLPKSMNLHTSDTDVPIFGPGDDEEKAAEGEEEGNPGAEEVLGEEEEEEEVYVPGTQSPEIVENGMAEEYAGIAALADNEFFNSTRVLSRPSCEDVKGNPLWTFWLYLFIRTFAELFPAAVVALLDAAVLRLSSVPDLNSSSISSSTAISNSRAHFGSQHVWGLVAMSLFSPLCGYLMDIHSGAFNFVDFAACFYALAALMIITAVLAAVLPFGAEPFCRSWWKDMGRVLGNIELVAMFCVCLALGVYWGGLETFLYWYLEDLGAPRVLLGATIAAGAVPAIPVFCAIQPIIRVCGHANLLIIALTVYSARLAGYSAITNPWVSLPWEALEVFTLHLAWAAALMYAYEKSPRSLTATTQALVTIIHFGVGRGLGSLLGGYGISVFGARNTLRMASVSAAVLAVVYLAFYHLFLRVHRCRREKDFDRRMRMEREEMMKPMAQGGSYPPVILTTPGPKTWRNGVT